MLKLACGALALALSTTVFAAPEASSFKDPLDVPAMMVKRQMLSTQMNAVGRAGDRLVAVGVRGLMLVSDDGGKQWTQVSVPVAIDLLDVHFPTAKDGWVVGHSGVVLRTRDGGNTWEKQLDGRMTGKMLTRHFQTQVESGAADAKRHLQDTEINYEHGPEQALQGVWFKDALNGFVCGTFGTLLATRDGGVTWESWVEKVDSERPAHLNTIISTKKGVMIASEKGMIFRLDPDKQRFVQSPTGYAGTFFSLVEVGDTVLASGLLGTAYQLKAGNTKWEKVETGVGGTIAASTALPDGGILLATVAGQLLSTTDGKRFEPVPVENPMPFSGVIPAGVDKAVVVGRGGVRTIPLKL